MPAVEVEHISRAFGAVQAVKDVSFTVEYGEIFGLLGPNGAGKTTTIRMMLSIFLPDSGSISMLGGPMDEAKKRQVGYMPEDRGLYRDLPLLDCLTYLATLKGLTRRDAQKRVTAYLEQLDLASSAHKKVKDLSRGMQQKAQLIAALAHDPQLLILDEPFSGLDPVNTRNMEDLLEEQKRAGKAIIMSSHQMAQVEAMCDRLLLIDHGGRVLYGSLAEIRKRFTSNAVRVWASGSLDGLPGVSSITQENGSYRLSLAPNAEPKAVMRALAERPDLDVQRFELATPSLDDIFISVVSAGDKVGS
jgi:ABC-2 type transport system ATP-binding protein